MKGMLQLLEWPLVSLQDLVCKQLRIMINMLWANLELMISGEHVSSFADSVLAQTLSRSQETRMQTAFLLKHYNTTPV